MTMILEPERSRLWRFMRFCIVVSWRFFTGNYMNGKQRNDATWWHDASSRTPVRKRNWWTQKSRMKRLLWRNLSFWPTMIFIFGLVFYTSLTLMILLGLTPFGLWFGYRRIRTAITNPMIEHFPSENRHVQLYVLKPKVRRFLTRLTFWRPKQKPGVIHPDLIRSIDMDIPPEVLREVISEQAQPDLMPVIRAKRIGP